MSQQNNGIVVAITDGTKDTGLSYFVAGPASLVGRTVNITLSYDATLLSNIQVAGWGGLAFTAQYMEADYQGDWWQCYAQPDTNTVLPGQDIVLSCSDYPLVQSKGTVAGGIKIAFKFVGGATSGGTATIKSADITPAP